MADIPANTSTTASITVGGTVNGSLETLGDHDWFRIQLTAGQAITVTLNGSTLEDPYLRILNSSGTVLYENDDISSGVNRDSRISFTATTSGTYYIDAGAWEDGYAGNYQLNVTTYTPPPLWTYDQIADQLISGYWGGTSHRFNVSPGGQLTVNLSALTPAGQTLARAALATWTDIVGIRFVEVGTGGQIVFDDNEEGAHAESTYSGSFITSSHVNVSTAWLADYGAYVGSYAFQTYIHEIGHALGLGHAGNYNGDANYQSDALYPNDSWATTVMSYFSQTENSYFAGLGFDRNFLLTPMIADIVAMSKLYGLSTTTRSGNTTYGFNSNAGTIYNANVTKNGAYTIFDAGGTDTLDYSGYSSAQKIDLNPETFSNVGGDTGNVAIARGTIIENAIGGSGSDTLIGNSRANVLDGRAGADTMVGGAGNDRYYVGSSGDVVTENASSGSDTVYSSISYDLGANLDNLRLLGSTTINATGNSRNNLLIGNSGANVLDGDAGADRLSGGKGADQLWGGSGADEFIFSAGQFGGFTAATAERIHDFSRAEGDEISLSRIDANSVVGGDQSFTFIGSQGFHGVAGELRYVQSATSTYIYGDTNGDGTADFLIVLDGQHSLNSGDFLL